MVCDAPRTTCLHPCVVRAVGTQAGEVSQILKSLLVTKNKGMLPPVGDKKPTKNSDQGDGVKYACCSWFLLFIILEVEAGVQEE